MNRAHRKRLLRRAEATAKLPPTEAVQRQMHLIQVWRDEFQRRLRTSPAEAREFQERKERELSDLGATETMCEIFRSACSERVFVPAHLTSNYAAIDLLELREIRKR